MFDPILDLSGMDYCGFQLAPEDTDPAAPVHLSIAGQIHIRMTRGQLAELADLMADEAHLYIPYDDDSSD